ncbi:MAG: hypothetical protein O2909_00735 [Chloroflexi bacterium]|nr:hypothetical protein [Chloroflexota bacterium]MDA1217954.1 hypothetical protein [Chloroflexota bacterium]
MVKVSITLPNNAQITFESEEPEVIHEIVGMVLRDLPRELMQSSVVVNGNGGHHVEPPNGTTPAVVEQSPEPLSSGEQPAAVDVAVSVAGKVNPTPKKAKETRAKPPVATVSVATPPVANPSASAAQASFAEFCRTSNPLGDMRRVVVAAEGARRFLGAESVDAKGLGHFFDLAGWPRPHSFVQTLRNAARSKFRWLERVPGRSGYYTVTEIGRTTALGG